MKHSFISKRAHNITKHGISERLSTDAQMIMLVKAESLAGSCMTYIIIAFILHSEAYGIRYYYLVGGT